jgi:excisionase family DNA binding protein
MSMLTDVDPDAELIERFGSVSPRRACTLLGIGNTKLYELIGNGELEAYKEGKSRRITVRSIAARRKRLLAEASTARGR